MGRIDDALQILGATEDGTERALQLAGLITTLFKIKGISLIVINQLAYDSYANTVSDYPEVELAVFAGDLPHRTELEIMRGQLYAQGSMYQWNVAGLPVRIHHDAAISNRDLCREFTTDHGVVKLQPVEDITADCILAAVFPHADPEMHGRAHQLLINGLADVFDMDWTALHTICHRPEYRVGDELAQMRLAAKKEVDALGMGRDHVGETGALPKIEDLRAALQQQETNAEEAAGPVTEIVPEPMPEDATAVAPQESGEEVPPPATA